MRLLIGEGCDLNETRKIEHCFVAQNKSSVGLILNVLPKIGHQLLHISQSDNGSFWISSLEMVSPAEVTKKTEKLIQLAKLYNAQYDGWGTTV